MGRRSRKRSSGGGASGGQAGDRPSPPATSGDRSPGRPVAYERAEARNAEVRARLRPLAPGERPLALRIAVLLAGFMAVANLVAAFLVDFGGAGTSTQVFAVLQSAVLAVAAVGMWRARYWAVLGFQAMLALQILVLFLALLRVERALVAVVVVAVIALLGAMFWSLIRVMARLQMPQRPAGSP